MIPFFLQLIKESSWKLSSEIKHVNSVLFLILVNTASITNSALHYEISYVPAEENKEEWVLFFCYSHRELYRITEQGGIQEQI